MKKVIVIVGPTASGKTVLSLRIAQAVMGEIINGDAVQVYKDLDVGSAKILPRDMAGIPHHLVSIRDPKDAYTVYHFQQDARALIDTIKVPVIVGGTGLYIKAALYDYEFIESARDLAFAEANAHLTNAELQDLLREKDPDIAIDVNNRRRLLRALEQAVAGTPRSSKTRKDVPLYDMLVLYLDLDRDVLTERLRQRLDKQLEEGFIEEVRMLAGKGIAVNAIGYRELYRYCQGEIDLETAKEAIIKASRRLAKKQKTWFFNQMSPKLLDALSPTLFADAMRHVQAFLKE
ncbi:MAG: tRNA (adenosine(37)-N6)-dimethylallyltransferase MiaA [Acholeplasmataceae bacterium]|nr:MAG: tRNA (adenosine(37)-N6)-dimethylallyltransferase MiaA [Acholeplasmataceae bacterium]